MKVRFCGGEFIGMDDVPEGTLVDVVVRPEDVIITKPEDGIIEGEVVSVIFKGMHYEVTVESGKYEMVIRTTKCYSVGERIGMKLEPDGICLLYTSIIHKYVYLCSLYLWVIIKIRTI